jgi:glutathione peroxidase
MMFLTFTYLLQGTHEEILEFASKYDGADKKFNWFTKAHVNGKNSMETYSFLKEKLPNEDGSKDIRWNYTTFLVDHEGNPAYRFSATKAVTKTLQPLVEELLKKKKEAKQ